MINQWNFCKLIYKSFIFHTEPRTKPFSTGLTILLLSLVSCYRYQQKLIFGDLSEISKKQPIVLSTTVYNKAMCYRLLLYNLNFSMLKDSSFKLYSNVNLSNYIFRSWCFPSFNLPVILVVRLQLLTMSLTVFKWIEVFLCWFAFPFLKSLWNPHSCFPVFSFSSFSSFHHS